jgi:hypothetical protein
LINSGHSYGYAKNKRIGRIEVHFADQRSFSYDLVLGQNIREWRFQAPGAVGIATSADLVEVYRGRSSEGDLGAIDMLKMTIPEEYRDGVLASVTFQDLINEDVKPMDTCLVIAGLTVRVRL